MTTTFGTLKTSAIVFAIVGLAALGCSQQDAPPKATPFPTATPTLSDASDECRELAKLAADSRYTGDYLLTDPAFDQFQEQVQDVGEPFGVGYFAVYDVKFDQLYETLLGLSIWINADGKNFYYRELDACMTERGYEYVVTGPLPAKYSLQELVIMECVVAALVEVEEDMGRGSVMYTTAYKTFAENRSGESEFVDLLRFERDYQELIGRSPFQDPEAMAAFRARAASCPE